MQGGLAQPEERTDIQPIFGRHAPPHPHADNESGLFVDNEQIVEGPPEGDPT